MYQYQFTVNRYYNIANNYTHNLFNNSDTDIFAELLH